MRRDIKIKKENCKCKQRQDFVETWSKTWRSLESFSVYMKLIFYYNRHRIFIFGLREWLVVEDCKLIEIDIDIFCECLSFTLPQIKHAKCCRYFVYKKQNIEKKEKGQWNIIENGRNLKCDRESKREEKREICKILLR